ncbi:MAG: hypothetical protein ACLTG0_08925 [Oscillibacter sp.]
MEAYHIDNVIHAVRPNLYTRQHEHVTHVSVVEKPSLLDVPLPLGKIMFEEDHAVLEEVKAFLQSQPWAGSMRSSSLTGRCWRSPPESATKGGMVARLAERLGISPPARLLRRGRGQRPVHADLGGGGFAPPAAYPLSGPAGPPSWQMRTTTLWRTSCPAWTKCTPERRKHRSATCGSGNSRFGCWHVPVSSGILNV